MSARAIQTSFASGELAPALYARVDLEKYHGGAAMLRNWFVDYRGGASTRPGTIFVGECLEPKPGQPRLIPFIVSTIAAYVLEFGDFYVRFISERAYVIDPGTLLPLIVVTPYAVGDLPLLKYTQSADVLTITHPSYPVYNLRRTSPTTFSFTPDVVGSLASPPTGVTASPVNSPAAALRYGYVVTTVLEGNESLPSFPVFCENSALNQLTGVVNAVTFNPIIGADFYRIYRVGPTPAGNGINVPSIVPTVYGFIGNSQTTNFIDNNITPDYSQTPPQAQNPFAPGQIASVTLITSTNVYTTPIVALIFTGNGVDAAGYAIVNIDTGRVVSVVLTNPGRNYTICTVTDTVGGSTYAVTFGQQTGTYPAAVGYFQQRRIFGGTNNFPESFVASQPGIYNNFNTHAIQLDSDAITASIASQQVNAIKSFTAMPTGLIIMTTGSGFLVSGGSANAAITPSNIVAFPQASSGCNDLPPLIINYDVLYGQAKGAVVRDLAFNFYVQSYTGTDRSVLASHLFFNHLLMEWCYSEEPFRLVQVVRDDGILLTFTYVPEQEIFAWTHYDTNGYFRSIASIPEGNVNSTYVIVQRTIGGVARYYVECFQSGVYDNLQDTWCVDSGLNLPIGGGNGTVNLSAAVGSITLTADSGIFNPGQVGYTLWGNHGQAMITGYLGPTQLTADVIQAFDILPDNGSPRPLVPSSWYLNPNVTLISGLGHLEGMMVTGIADGFAFTPRQVIGGQITLDNPASLVTVGLGYQCQLQTLKLDLGEPTIQGKRKMISAVTARVNRAAGLSVGKDFDNLTPMKELVPTYPPEFKSIDARSLIAGTWNKDGQVCFQQDYPYPATILGVIPEVVVGDTGR